MKNGESSIGKLARLTRGELKTANAERERSRQQEYNRAKSEIDALHRQTLAERAEAERRTIAEQARQETLEIAMFAAHALADHGVTPVDFINTAPDYKTEGIFFKRQVFNGTVDRYAFSGWKIKSFGDLSSKFRAYPAGPGEKSNQSLVLMTDGDLAFVHRTTDLTEEVYAEHKPVRVIDLNNGKRMKETNVTLWDQLSRQEGATIHTWEKTSIRHMDDDTEIALRTGLLNEGVNQFSDHSTRHPGASTGGPNLFELFDAAKNGAGMRNILPLAKQVLIGELRRDSDVESEMQIGIARLLASHAINVK